MMIAADPSYPRAIFAGDAIDDPFTRGDGQTTIEIRGKQIGWSNGRLVTQPTATVKTFRIENVQAMDEQDEATKKEIEELVGKISTTDLTIAELPNLAKFVRNHLLSVVETNVNRANGDWAFGSERPGIYAVDPTNLLGIDLGFIATTDAFDRFLSYAAEQMSPPEREELRRYIAITQEARLEVSKILNTLQGEWDQLAIENPTLLALIKQVPQSVGVVPTRFGKLFSLDQVALLNRIDAVRTRLAQEARTELAKVNAIRQKVNEELSMLFAGLTGKFNDFLVTVLPMVKKSARYLAETGLYAGKPGSRDYVPADSPEYAAAGPYNQ